MSFLRPFSSLFRVAVELKNNFYEHGIFTVHRLETPVLSVGNLSVGGTGKTSFVIWLLRALSGRGRRVGVVSRGYGGSFSGIHEVPVGGDPEIYGDEPCLMALENLGPVVVGADRVAAGKALLAKHKVDWILADDAFQHRRLFRDYDVVLIDLSEPFSSFCPLPQGRLREDFSSLKRADAVVLTKRSLASSQDDVNKIESLIPKDKLSLEMDYELDFISDWEGKKVQDSDGPYVLFSGVARPPSVLKLVKDRFKIADHVIYRDHHPYSKKDVDFLLSRVRDFEDGLLLTTAKDAVKLKSYPELRNHLRVINLKFDVKGETDEFFKIFLR